MSKIAVAGAGKYGQAMAHLLATNGHDVLIYSRDAETVEQIHNKIPTSRFEEADFFGLEVDATSDLEELAQHGSYLFVAATSATMREATRALAEAGARQDYVTSLAKGFEPGTFKLMIDVMQEEMGEERNYLAVSGPSFATDMVARRQIDDEDQQGVDVAGPQYVSDRVASFLNIEYFEAVPTDDVIGVQVAGAMKNVYAIAGGIAEQLGYVAKSLIVEEGLRETALLVEAMGGDVGTLQGLSGRGDFRITMSPQSRNYEGGMHFVRDREGAHANREIETIEGYDTLLAVPHLQQEYGVTLPTAHLVHKMVHEGAELQHPLGPLAVK